MKHARSVHENDPNFVIYCSQCGRSYKKWTSLKKHLHREHPGVELCNNRNRNKCQFMCNISGAIAVENNPDNGDGILDLEEVHEMEDQVADVNEKWDNALSFASSTGAFPDIRRC